MTTIYECVNCGHMFFHTKGVLQPCVKCASDKLYPVKTVDRYVTTLGGKKICILTLKEQS